MECSKSTHGCERKAYSISRPALSACNITCCVWSVITKPFQFQQLCKTEKIYIIITKQICMPLSDHLRHSFITQQTLYGSTLKKDSCILSSHYKKFIKKALLLNLWQATLDKTLLKHNKALMFTLMAPDRWLSTFTLLSAYSSCQSASQQGCLSRRL